MKIECYNASCINHAPRHRCDRFAGFVNGCVSGSTEYNVIIIPEHLEILFQLKAETRKEYDSVRNNNGPESM